jgi:hypothetical protein
MLVCLNNYRVRLSKPFGPTTCLTELSWQRRLEVGQLKYHFRDRHTTIRGKLVAYYFRFVIQKDHFVNSICGLL